MTRYEAVMEIDIELFASNEDEARKFIHEEITSRLRAMSRKDNRFKIWTAGVQLDELTESREKN